MSENEIHMPDLKPQLVIQLAPVQWEEMRDEVAQEIEGHWRLKDRNLGQYRTEHTCVCGERWVTNGHSSLPQPTIQQHRADAVLAVLGFKRLGDD